MKKSKIIEYIHQLVSNNVIGNKQAMSRYKGFRGELFLESYMKEKYPSRKYFDGGMIISRGSCESSLNNSIYISVLGKDEYTSDYAEIFGYLSHLGFEEMILILYDEEKSEMKPVMIFPATTILLPVPAMSIYYFVVNEKKFMPAEKDIISVLNYFESNAVRTSHRHKVDAETAAWLHDHLSDFSQAQLLKIYMNRLILDGFIGFGKKKGKPSDIDLIVKNSAGKFSLIEIKEKDLPKKSKKGFGLDVPRLEDMQRISRMSGLAYFLVVRHINNQSDRDLIGYKYISINDFAHDVMGSATVVGGTGMRSESSINNTLICSFDLFRNL